MPSRCEHDASRSPCEQIGVDLDRFVALLLRWQGTHNLVGRATLDDIRERHVEDSLQLLTDSPPFRSWADLGSGAGFPGLIVAIASKAQPERRFTLVESNGKKAAFLRAAIRETGANAAVAAERIETHGASLTEPFDVVSARALAPLPKLLGLAAPYLGAASTLLLLKGQDFVQECEIASKSWDFDMITRRSATNPDGHVVRIRNVRARTEPA